MGTSFLYLLKYYYHHYFECSFWIVALAALYFMNANTAASSFCIFKWLHVSYCPGCGLGHSVHYALHLQFTTSFQHHPMGIVAVLIILNRIKQLSFKPKSVIQ
jgi:hypothetical protein